MNVEELLPVGTELEDATEGRGTVKAIEDGAYVIDFANGKTIHIPVEAVAAGMAKKTPWNTILNKHRIKEGYYASVDEMEFNGCFVLRLKYTKANGKSVEDRIFVMSSNGMGWEHVSVSLMDGKDAVPRWELMCAVKELWWGKDAEVVQFHPAAGNYVNQHKGCLHLWRSLGDKIPTPPPQLVGLLDAVKPDSTTTP